MSDEIDDAFEEDGRHDGAMARKTVGGPGQARVARLVSRVYGAAGAPLRARMLAALFARSVLWA
jgi:hypothetical protein